MLPTAPPTDTVSETLMRFFRAGVFWLIHVGCFLAIWTGVSPLWVGVCIALYAVRMFGVTAGYHRYFSHKTFKLGRVPQFLLAWLAQSTCQKSVLWWAAHHRHHHRHSDKETDIHSPHQQGFWYSHVGWILDPETDDTNMLMVRDWQRFPELLWLHRNDMVPPFSLALACFLLGGWEGLIVGFCWSTVLLWHGTFTINSLSHVFGTRRYETSDDSRNNPLLAFITLGEGWHNNHHHYPGSCRQGFRWYEFDMTYYALRALSWVGIVRDIKEPPRHVVRNEPHPSFVAAQARRAAEEAATAAATAAEEALRGRRAQA